MCDDAWVVRMPATHALIAVWREWGRGAGRRPVTARTQEHLGGVGYIPWAHTCPPLASHLLTQVPQRLVAASNLKEYTLGESGARVRVWCCSDLGQLVASPVVTNAAPPTLIQGRGWITVVAPPGPARQGARSASGRVQDLERLLGAATVAVPGDFQGASAPHTLPPSRTLLLAAPPCSPAASAEASLSDKDRDRARATRSSGGVPGSRVRRSRRSAGAGPPSAHCTRKRGRRKAAHAQSRGARPLPRAAVWDVRGTGLMRAVPPGPARPRLPDQAAPHTHTCRLPPASPGGAHTHTHTHTRALASHGGRHPARPLATGSASHRLSSCARSSRWARSLRPSLGSWPSGSLGSTTRCPTSAGSSRRSTRTSTRTRPRRPPRSTRAEGVGGGPAAGGDVRRRPPWGPGRRHTPGRRRVRRSGRWPSTTGTRPIGPALRLPPVSRADAARYVRLHEPAQLGVPCSCNEQARAAGAGQQGLPGSSGCGSWRGEAAAPLGPAAGRAVDGGLVDGWPAGWWRALGAELTSEAEVRALCATALAGADRRTAAPQRHSGPRCRPSRGPGGGAHASPRRAPQAAWRHADARDGGRARRRRPHGQGALDRSARPTSPWPGASPRSVRRNAPPPRPHWPWVGTFFSRGRHARRPPAPRVQMF